MKFFKLSNRIFDYPLSPKAFMVYAYLISRMNLLQTVVISYKAISDACHMDTKTVYKAIDELVSNSLVTKENRYNILGYAKNKYTVIKPAGGWFMVEHQIFKTSLKSTDFIVYCFIKKCMDTKQEAFPSLRAIVNGTRISHSRVALSVKYLREHTYLNRVKRHYKKTKAYKHNRYLKFKLAEKKKKVRYPQRTFFIKNFTFKKSYFLIYIIGRGAKNVKSFLFLRGSPKIP